MIKKQGIIFAFLVIVYFLLGPSCSKENRWDCFKGTGKRTTEIREVPAFTKVLLESNVDVVIKQGPVQEVKVEAGEHLIPCIETKVDSGTLHIINKNKCSWARSYKKGTITVYLTMPTTRFIWHFGSGFLQAPDTLHCDTLDIWAHQTGNVDLMVDAFIVYTNMHTTSDLTLRGRSVMLGGWHMGEGYLHCEDLVTDIVWTTTGASGDEYFNVVSGLSAVINWEGNTFYTGSPVVERKGTGKGELIKMN